MTRALRHMLALTLCLTMPPLGAAPPAEILLESGDQLKLHPRPNDGQVPYQAFDRFTTILPRLYPGSRLVIERRMVAMGDGYYSMAGAQLPGGRLLLHGDVLDADRQAWHFQMSLPQAHWPDIEGQIMAVLNDARGAYQTAREAAAAGPAESDPD